MRVLVPFRSTGKTRLSTVLSDSGRLRVATRMRDHVMTVCAEAGLEAEMLDAPGLVDALRTGLVGATGPTLLLMADLPLLTAADLLALPTDRVAVASDRRDEGVNAVAMPSPDALDVLLGGGPSLARYVAAVPDIAVIRRPGLAFDLDDGQDWSDLCSIDPSWLSSS